MMLSGGAPPCPEGELRVWRKFGPKVPHAARPIVHALFERICEAIQTRGLAWSARTQYDNVGFKETTSGAFKIVINVEKTPTSFDPPSFLIYPGRPLEDLGSASKTLGRTPVG
jgi:hypothetical protein